MRLLAACILLVGIGSLIVKADPPTTQTVTVVPTAGAYIPYALLASEGKVQKEYQERTIALLESINSTLKDMSAAQGIKQKATKNEKLISLLQKNCAACHTPPGSETKGLGFDIFEADGKTPRKLDFRSSNLLKQAILNGKMPPEGRPQLSEEEKSLVE